MAFLNCVVVTPTTTAIRAQADFVAVPLYDGEVGIAPGRAPLIGRLACGELRVQLGPSVARYFVDGGLVEVADNVVSVLTTRVIPAAEIDRQAARAQLQESLALPTTTEELERTREQRVAQARALLRVSRQAGTA